MRFLVLLALVVLSSVASLLAAPPATPSPRPRCAFADERCMTLMGVSVFAAEHYLAHGRWPQTGAQLRTQARRQNTRSETDEFFARFSRLDLQPLGRDLRLDLRFRADGQDYRQSILLHRGKNTDAILQGATEPPSA